MNQFTEVFIEQRNLYCYLFVVWSYRDFLQQQQPIMMASNTTATGTRTAMSMIVVLSVKYKYNTLAKCLPLKNMEFYIWQCPCNGKR